MFEKRGLVAGSLVKAAGFQDMSGGIGLLAVENLVVFLCFLFAEFVVKLLGYIYQKETIMSCVLDTLTSSIKWSQTPIMRLQSPFILGTKMHLQL